MTHFEVIGESEVEEIEGGDVLGDVLGYAGPMGDYEGGTEVVGYDDEGEMVVVGAPRRRRLRRIVRPKGRGIAVVRKPGWRGSQMAPGVIAPDQGMLVLPMQGDPSNTFSATVNQITYTGELQKPFRGERPLVTVVRTGTSAVGRLLGQLFVGTDLQQADITTFDIEAVGSPTAFGVRLAMKPAQPGVKIRIMVTPSVALTTTDTIACYVQLLGRILH